MLTYPSTVISFGESMGNWAQPVRTAPNRNRYATRVNGGAQKVQICVLVETHGMYRHSRFNFLFELILTGLAANCVPHRIILHRSPSVAALLLVLSGPKPAFAAESDPDPVSGPSVHLTPQLDFDLSHPRTRLCRAFLRDGYDITISSSLGGSLSSC